VGLKGNCKKKPKKQEKFKPQTIAAEELYKTVETVVYI